MTRCTYAACTRVAMGHADGWDFCEPHLRDHNQERVDDASRRTYRPEPWLRARYGGELGPCGTWEPLIRILEDYRLGSAA